MYRFVLLFLFQQALGQPLQLELQHLNELDGFDATYCDFIYQDYTGLIWISSLNGVYAYDGHDFQHYLPEANIQSSFFEDEQNDLWFAQYQGLCRYQRSIDSCSCFSLIDEQGNNIEENYHIFYLEQNRYLWLVANFHIYSYDVLTEDLRKISSTKGRRFAVDLTENGRVKRLYACPWEEGGALERIDFDQNYHPQKHYLFDSSPYQSVKFKNATIDSDGTVWVFTDTGLINYDPNSEKVMPIPLGDMEQYDCTNGVWIDDQHLIFIVNKKGLFLIDRIAKKVIRTYRDKSVQNLRNLYFDNKEQLWLTLDDNGQVSYTWWNANQWQNPFVTLLLENVPVVASLVQGPDKQVWCATESQGVFVFDDSGALMGQQTYGILQNGEQEVFTNIRQIRKDRLGKMWLVANKKIFEWRNAQWYEVFDGKAREVFFTLELPGTNQLLSTNQGILEVQKSKNGFKSLRAWKLGQTQINTAQSFQIFSGPSGRIYVPYNGDRLGIYDFVGTKDSMRLVGDWKIKCEVYCIHEQGEKVWLGTSTGVWYFSLSDFDSLIRVEGLPMTLINGIQVDKKGRFWLASNQGLWRATWNDKYKTFDQLERFREIDGLPTTSFTLYASLHTSTGKMWLGTNEGLCLFDPLEINPYPYPAPVVWKNLYVNNELWKDSPIDPRQVTQLSYRERDLEIEVAALTHYHPQFSRIHFRMLGYQDEWKSRSTGEPIIFNKIPVGEYQLEMYSTTANGLKSSIKGWPITILAPWWQMWWAKGGFLLLLFGLIYLILWLYWRRKLMEQRRLLEREKALQLERNRIASELHDDLGAGLSVIRFLSSDVLHNRIADQQDVGSINRIHESSGELLEKMGEIIWAMNAENDTLLNLIEYLQDYGYDYLGTHQLDCEIDLPEDIPDWEWSGAARRTVILIYKEILHNIIKHASATQVGIKIDYQHQNLLISVGDNGQGFVYENNQKQGNGLKNIRQRIESLNGQIEYDFHEGTLVKVSIPFIVYK